VSLIFKPSVTSCEEPPHIAMWTANPQTGNPSLQHKLLARREYLRLLIAQAKKRKKPVIKRDPQDLNLPAKTARPVTRSMTNSLKGKYR